MTGELRYINGGHNAPLLANRNGRFDLLTRSTAVDAGNLEGYNTVLLRYSCLGIFTPGDYDGSGLVDLADLSRLIAYLTNNGIPPVGGAGRADANCDGVINIGDVVYFMNYLMSMASAPCY